MQVISFFSGIGGFEYGSEQAGWKPVVSCEINPFGRRVLKYYWPDVYHHDDIKTLDYATIKEKSSYNESEPTIVVGGFPCQPYSSAGKRLGKADARHLWPEMLRLIREIQPEWVVGENVFGIINWNGGMVFHEIQTDLESAGYEVQPYVLPACGVNAPHKRQRVWFVAHSKCVRHRGESKTSGFDLSGKIGELVSNSGCDRNPVRSEVDGYSRSADDSNDNRHRFEGESISETVGIPQAHRAEVCSWLSHGTIGGNGIDSFTTNTGIKGLQEWSDKIYGSETSSNTPDKGFQESEPGEQHNELLNAERNDSTDVSDTNMSGCRQGNEEMAARSSEQPDRIRVQQRTDTNSGNLQLQGGKFSGVNTEQGQKSPDQQPCRPFCPDWEKFPTESPVCSRNDGIPSRLVRITVQGRRGRRTLTPAQAYSRIRIESIKAYGNAIVWKVFYQIARAINDYINLIDDDQHNFSC